MASIEWKTKKGGTPSALVTVSGGIDSTGHQIRYRRTYTPAPGTTQRKAEKEANEFAVLFEQEVRQGYQIDNKRKFGEYARYVIDLKERSGAKKKTIVEYNAMLPRIDAAIGHIKLADLRPQHLNDFYKELAQSGARKTEAKAVAHPGLREMIKNAGFTFTSLSAACGCSVNTISNAVKGIPIRESKAAAISAALGKHCNTLFDIEADERGLSPKTILEYHRLISTICAQAEREMLIPYNPAKRATPPKLKKHNPDYFQPEELDAIISALDTEPVKWRALVLLLINSGCRRGEVAGVKWEDIDFERNTWTICREVMYTTKTGLYEDTTKTGNVRTVCLADGTIAALKEHRRQQALARLALGPAWTDSGRVFTTDTGVTIHPDSIGNWLNGFSTRHNLPSIHPHAFRHTAASLMIADGVDMVTTAATLGHANPTTTANIYSHMIETQKARATSALGAAIDRHDSDEKSKVK